MPKTRPPQHARQAMRASEALFWYAKEFGDNRPVLTDPDLVSDLLTDLQYFCRRHNIRYGRCAALAHANYRRETKRS